jgi:hypothetical protein
MPTKQLSKHAAKTNKVREVALLAVSGLHDVEMSAFEPSD